MQVLCKTNIVINNKGECHIFEFTNNQMLALYIMA